MDSLLNSLDNLEESTNEVQQIANDDAQARVEMEAMMNVILVVITEIQQSLNELEDLQDASEDVAKLKGKIAQNNQKQNELLKKINALKETLQKSPNIRNLQEQLQNLKTNLTNNILDHKRLQRRPPGNSPNQTRLGATVAPTPKQRGMSPPMPDPRGNQMLGGYRYSGNSPGKIINIKSRTKSKKKKNRTRTRTKRRM